MSKRISIFKAEMAAAKTRFDTLWAKVRTEAENEEMRNLISRMQKQEVEFKQLLIEIEKIEAKRGALVNSILIFTIVALLFAVALTIILKSFALLFVLPVLVLAGIFIAYFLYPT